MSGRPIRAPEGQDELEDRTIQALIAHYADHPCGPELAQRFGAAGRRGRHLSGVGFFTDFGSDHGPSPAGCSNPLTPRLQFHLDGWAVDEGIKDGRFGGFIYFFANKGGSDMLEGFTYGEVAWPSDVRQVRVLAAAS